MNNPGPDFMWIVQAAGEDQRKLAEAALLFAAFTFMHATTDGPPEALYGMTLAMDVIAQRIGIPQSEVLKQFRDTVRKAAQ